MNAWLVSFHRKQEFRVSTTDQSKNVSLEILTFKEGNLKLTEGDWRVFDMSLTFFKTSYFP